MTISVKKGRNKIKKTNKRKKTKQSQLTNCRWWSLRRFQSNPYQETWSHKKVVEDFLKTLHIIPCSTFSTTTKFRVRFYKRKITVLSQFIPWCSQYFVKIDNHNKEPNQAHHTPCLFLPFFHHLFPHSWLLQTGRDHRTLACWKKDNDTVNSYLAWIYSQVYKFVW